jgi:hypothetical protein
MITNVQMILGSDLQHSLGLGSAYAEGDGVVPDRQKAIALRRLWEATIE